MIPAIALMIGAYVTTRMLVLLRDEMQAKDTNNVLVSAATITILVVSFAMFVVITNEREAARAAAEAQEILDTFR